MENILLITLMSQVTWYGSQIGLKGKKIIFIIFAETAQQQKIKTAYIINSPGGMSGGNDVIGEVVFQP